MTVRYVMPNIIKITPQNQSWAMAFVSHGKMG